MNVHRLFVEMITVCQKCGVTGYPELLIYCNVCQISAEHRYCLDKIPKDRQAEVHWSCEQCVTSVPKVGSFDNHKFRRGRKIQLATYRHRRYNRAADFLLRMNYRHLRSTCTAKTFSSVERPLNGIPSCSEAKAVTSASGFASTLQPFKSNSLERGELQQGKEVTGVHPGRENDKHPGSETDGKKTKRKRKLILEDDDHSDEETPFPKFRENCTDQDVIDRSLMQVNKPLVALSPTRDNKSCGTTTAKLDESCDKSCTVHFCYVPARPIVCPVWRGCFDILEGKYGPVVAHLSNRACEKVRIGANMLPKTLRFEMLSRCNAWPKSFNNSPPTDDDIALYFFPGDARVKSVFDQLLEDINKRDLVLKVAVDEAELLVFSSIILPSQNHMFNGWYYLWGVFKGRQVPTTPRHVLGNCFSKSNETKVPGSDGQHYECKPSSKPHVLFGRTITC